MFVSGPVFCCLKFSVLKLEMKMFCKSKRKEFFRIFFQRREIMKTDETKFGKQWRDIGCKDG